MLLTNMENCYKNNSTGGVVKNLGTPFSIKDILTRTEPTEVLVKKHSAEYEPSVNSSTEHHYHFYQQKNLTNKDIALCDFEKKSTKSSSSEIELSNFYPRDYPKNQKLPLSLESENNGCILRSGNSFYTNNSLRDKVMTTKNNTSNCSVNNHFYLGSTQKDYNPSTLAYFEKVLQRNESHPVDMRRLMMSNLDSGKFTSKFDLKLI